MSNWDELKRRELEQKIRKNIPLTGREQQTIDREAKEEREQADREEKLRIKEEKERLIKLISDNFSKVLNLVNIVIGNIRAMSEDLKTVHSNKISDVMKILGEIDLYLEAQTAFLKSMESFKKIDEEIKS